MLMYTRQLVLELNNPTIVVITDRNDLDDQLFATFSKSADYLRQTPKQADTRKKTTRTIKRSSWWYCIYDYPKVFRQMRVTSRWKH